MGGMYFKRGVKDVGLVLDDQDGNRFLGVCLGWDYTAEHEFGIEYLRSDFGLPDKDKIVGLKRRTITRLPANYRFTKLKGKGAGIFMQSFHNHEVEPKSLTLREPWPKGSEPEHLAAGWSDAMWVIRGDKVVVKELTELHEAFQKLDVAFWLGGNANPFARSGLILAIASKVPQKYQDDMKEADLENNRLRKAVADSGIEERLRAAGKSWFALSPRFQQKDGQEVLRFWLNPRDQHLYNHGWYGVEELDLWVRNEGPVMMAPKASGKW